MKLNSNQALIIADPYNVRYFSGFSGGEGYLFMTESKKTVLVDSRYGIWAKNECNDSDIIVIGSEGYYPWFNKLIKSYNINEILLEGDYLSHNIFERMKEKLECDSIISISNELTKDRMVKSEEEIEKVKKAEKIGDDAFTHILTYIKDNYKRPEGLTEKQVALELEFYMRSHGASALSFDVIAASGLNSASPHAMPSDRGLCEGDFLTMDFGCVYEGYCSDMTRTIVIGKASEKQIHIYNIVKHAALTALDNIKAGMTGKEADKIARDIIEEAGYGSNFGHSLGHGIGLFIHELPTLSKRDDTVLKPGMIVSVEPGIYIEGFGGVRIEDAVVIEENGIRNLTESTKELIEIL